MRMSELWADLTLFDRVENGPEKVVIIGPMLRDQFAMAALPALIKLDSIETVKEAAEAAYYVADAMLKAREAK